MDQELYDKVERDAEIERQEALLSEMGLTRNDTEKLKNTMLSANEAVSAKQEELLNIRQHKGRKADWEEYVDAKRRMGYPMHHSEFIRRLRTIVPSLIVTDGQVRGTIGLYAVRSTPVKEVLTYKGKEKTNFPCPIYLGWIHLGYMPEYEIDVVNAESLPIAQKRGWRTILMRMIVRWYVQLDRFGQITLDIHGRKIRTGRASFITEEQALKAFGPPTHGITSSGYRLQLYNFRNSVPEPISNRR